MKSFLKTTLACVLALVIAGLILPFVGIGIISGIVSSSGDSGVIEKNSVLFLDLNGTIEERTVENPLATIMNDEFKSYGLDEIIAAIKEAKGDKNIEGIYLFLTYQYILREKSYGKQTCLRYSRQAPFR